CMLECLGGGKPIGRVLLQTPCDALIERLRQFWKILAKGIWIFVRDLHQGRSHRRSTKGISPAEGAVEDRPDTPYVRALVGQVGAFELLGRHVLRRSEERALFRLDLARAVGELRNAEVHQLDDRSTF